jgi:hypothetical protein
VAPGERAQSGSRCAASGSGLEPAPRRAADLDGDFADAPDERFCGARDQPVPRKPVRRAAAVDRIALARPADKAESIAFGPSYHSQVAIAKPLSAVYCSALLKRLPMDPESSPSAACTPTSSLSPSGCVRAARYAGPTAVRLGFIREPI